MHTLNQTTPMLDDAEPKDRGERADDQQRGDGSPPGDEPEEETACLCCGRSLCMAGIVDTYV